MVKHLNHFCFVERYKDALRFFPVGAMAFETVGLELFSGMKKTGVTTLMKRCKELYSPGIASLLSSSVDKNGDALIDVFGEIRIAFRAENWAGPGIGIQEFEVTGG